MAAFFRNPFNIGMAIAIALVAALTAFAVFKPVKVVPRIADAPDYTLVDAHGQPFTSTQALGRISLYGFGYTSDPTGVLDTTLGMMQSAHEAARAAGYNIRLVLILFDTERDTPERLQAFAAERGLDPAVWVLLTGDAVTLKQTIGQGFGVYYESVPLSEILTAPSVSDEVALQDSYGFIQAERYMLVDDHHILRAEYRPETSIEIVVRDLNLIVREQNSKGVSRAVNEAAHLFLCYPSS
ncbi:MAG: SCO family protein [Anaerolineae bacterium]|nr:SCO family protein [Anaerolineae bacterium]